MGEPAPTVIGDLAEREDILHHAVRKLAAQRAKTWVKAHLRAGDRRSPSAKGHPFVYVFQVKGFDLVKIGYSRDPARRLVDIENGSGMYGGIVPVLRMAGTRELERELHKRFAAQRLFGEWFRFSGPVAEWASAVILNKVVEPGSKAVLDRCRGGARYVEERPHG